MKGSSEEIRSFVALELPEDLKDEITKILTKCRQIAPKGVKWVEPKNLHFTLQFFGSLNKEKLEKIAAFLEDVFSELYSFSIYKLKLELVPPVTDKKKVPRLIWVGCDYDNKDINRAVGKIKRIMGTMSIPIEKRPFKMHLTLGRVKDRINTEQIAQLNEINLTDSIWTISKATLCESKLYPQGPEYIRLNSYELKKS